MRKYCRACGSSLTITEETPEPEPVEESVEEPIAGAPSFSVEDELVSPSAVASEQVELEGDASETEVEFEETPVVEDVSTDPEEVDVPGSEQMGYDEGREVVKDILEKVRAAEERTMNEEVETLSETDMKAPEEDLSENIDEPIVDEESTVEDEVDELSDDELESPPPEETTVEEPVPEVPIPASKTVDAPTKDEKIRLLETEIKAFTNEHEQLQSELVKLRSSLDEEVERFRVAAETKRTRVESIESDLSLAKKEYSDATKEHKNAENKRKKEMSDAEKWIRDVHKRIKKAEDAREKRIRDLEKD